MVLVGGSVLIGLASGSPAAGVTAATRLRIEFQTSC